MESLPRREREKLMRKTEMVAAACKVFARKGFANTTLDDVAELAEFGKGTLYNYFPNKEALFASVLEDAFGGFREIFVATLGDESLSFQEKITALVEGSLRYAFTNPEGILLIARESHHLRENNPLMQLHPQLVGMLTDTIAAEQKRLTSMNDSDPGELAMLLMNMVIGQFMNRINLRFRGVCIGVSQGEGGQEAIARMFEEMKSVGLEEGVARSADLILSVYLHGIMKKSKTTRSGK